MHKSSEVTLLLGERNVLLHCLEDQKSEKTIYIQGRPRLKTEFGEVSNDEI